MIGRDKKLFCYFSGYAQLNVTLTQYHFNTITRTLGVEGENESQHRLREGEHIQLKGVLFVVTSTQQSSFKASTTFELLNPSATMPITTGEKYSLGILAEYDETHNDLWMLQPSVSGVVAYRGCSVLDGHEHTLKLNFEAPLLFDEAIQDGKHIGLEGSSLTVQEVKRESDLIKFSIYCGRETREKTRFNEKLPKDTLINFNEPAAVVKLAR